GRWSWPGRARPSLPPRDASAAGISRDLPGRPHVTRHFRVAQGCTRSETRRMPIAARWGRGAVFAVSLSCQGAKGPKGDPGAARPQGEAGPSVSINGLDGGTVNGAVTVTGDLTAGGHLLTWPRNPSLVSGITTNGCGPFLWSGGATTNVSPVGI